MKKLSNTEAGLKENVAYKKKRVTGFRSYMTVNIVLNKC